MKLINSTNDWYFKITFSAPIDFCVYMLQSYNLLATPFDKHVDDFIHNETATLYWKEWFHAVIFAQLKKEQRTPQSYNPTNLWNGQSLSKDDLNSLWTKYQREHKVQHVPNIDSMNIWQETEMYKHILPPIQYFTVFYPEPVEYILHPSIIIISVTNELSIQSSRLISAMKELYERYYI